ncbi:MFS transporter [Oceanibaculum pacificum]|uniref:Major facilitator superfamily (MFS) profile domain-containing protein n=1 Tax=Oceanibaculum pacificum TaxID=580166 RepID=A0A154W250_9PROT|nr:MFS transporter [Oceanibaculum pacificum]KZD07598.1 hypothetical protein AUP43_09925 [Oceanibaculum pacificum]
MPIWATALAATFTIQAVGAFLLFSVPVIGPLLTARAGVSAETIGYLSSIMSGGICWFLAGGGPMLERFGAIRLLQIGLILCALGFAGIGYGWWPLAVVGALVLGFGYGTNSPAGSQTLSRTAPPGHRVLIFSLKQAGVPLGAALSGLVIAPLAATYGLEAAVGLAVGVSLLAILAVQPTRRALDDEQTATRRFDWVRALLSWRTVVRSIALLKGHQALPMLTALGVAFAILQACLTAFLVTYVVTRHGFTLAQGGMVAAVLQGSNLVARIVLGWLADRLGDSMRHLSVQALVAAAALVALALYVPDSPGDPLLYLLVALAGFTGISWNGIHMAEVARLAPSGRVSDVTSAAALFGFTGSVAGPLLFAWGVTLTGSYALVYCAVAGQLALMGLLCWRVRA